METKYEWCCEWKDENEDILEPLFTDTLIDAYKQSERPDVEQFDIVLVKSVGDEIVGIDDRQYAYLENNKLPAEFPDGSIVPKRFHAEVERYFKS